MHFPVPLYNLNPLKWSSVRSRHTVLVTELRTSYVAVAKNYLNMLNPSAAVEKMGSSGTHLNSVIVANNFTAVH